MKMLTEVDMRTKLQKILSSQLSENTRKTNAVPKYCFSQQVPKKQVGKRSYMALKRDRFNFR